MVYKKPTKYNDGHNKYVQWSAKKCLTTVFFGRKKGPDL